MKDYSVTVDRIVELLGGEANIQNAFHCITRLRFELKDESLAQVEEIKKLDGVMGVNYVKPQYQVIIGNDVDKAWDALVKRHPNIHFKDAGTMEEKTGKTKNPILAFVSVVAEVFTQFIGALAGVGMIKAVMSVISIYNLLPKDSSTYIILNAMGDGLFYFLPFFVAMSAAKKFKMDSFVAMAILAAVQHPTITALLGSGNPIDFFKIPVETLSYS